MTGKRMLFSLLLAAVLALLLAACGDDDEASISPTGSASPGTSTSPGGDPSESPVPVSSAGVTDLAGTEPLLKIIGPGEGELRSDLPGLAAGDFNGDGFDDILIGARFADGPGDKREDAGEAYVLFGSSDLGGSADLSSGEHDLIIYGERAGDNLGFAAAAADVNGDGLDDIILGAPFAVSEGPPPLKSGAAFVIFGSTNLPDEIDLAAEIASVTLLGANTSAFFGDDLATGDINGDGTADIIVGATFDRGPSQDGAQATQGGAAYVYFGRSSWPEKMSTRAGEYDAALFGASSLDELGDTVAAGDINGDGFDDIIVTAEAADGPEGDRPVAAEVHVVFGAPDLAGDFFVAQGDPDVSLYGAESNDTLGFHLATGDVNADGVDDLVITARLADGVGNAASSAGEAYVLLGSETLPEEIDLAEGFGPLIAVHAPDDGDLMGTALIADLTAAEANDLLLGIAFADGPENSRRDGGEIHIIQIAEVTEFTSLTRIPERLVVYGGEEEGRLGNALVAADVNGDGRLELIAIAQDADGPGDGQQDFGVIYVFNLAEPE